ncbi:hypothetical protein DUI87_02647 [Hirundo rustica rustica]|uniref:Uncharacterized protein n=1 Tax=Hirundo rustica rustica TaxID=333673 RepID=A0A3M0L8Q1_HIRRU|nr:hypothetical protein DUI87_02647 [Hirundo rustica rustica]
MEAQKNTLAAEKMDYLTAGGNPVGRGKGRGVYLWVVLVILSLVLCRMDGLPSPKGQMGQERQCLKETQKEPTWSQNVAFQNRIALDYLLAEEGGVCGKFNESECCIEINDYGETIRGLAAEIKKVAHVPVQKWNSILQASWWDQLFGIGAWWKKVGFFILCSVAGVIFLPCLIPCFIRLIHTVVQGMQIAALPTDPELASGGFGKNSKISKIMKLNEERSRAAEVLTKFEARVQEEEECRKYWDEPEEEWDDYKDDV